MKSTDDTTISGLAVARVADPSLILELQDFIHPLGALYGANRLPAFILLHMDELKCYRACSPTVLAVENKQLFVCQAGIEAVHRAPVDGMTPEVIAYLMNPVMDGMEHEGGVISGVGSALPVGDDPMPVPDSPILGLVLLLWSAQELLQPQTVLLKATQLSL